MKALIIGGTGFVGKYLIEHLKRDCLYDVVVTKLVHEVVGCKDDVRWCDLDILDKSSVASLLKAERPDYIFNLAAQSSVAISWKQPNLTCNININGVINILEAVRESNGNPKVLLVGSGEEYGYIRAEDIPLTEDARLTPGNIYAATKACQNMIGKIYATAYSMHIIMVRAFNHIGPGQTLGFVVSDFCKQIAEIEKGIHEPVIWVGNLRAKRDFTDVRDVVRSYGLLIEKGGHGEVYNVGSGHAISIDVLLKQLLTLSPMPIEVRMDKARFRPVDVPVIEADITKLHACTGWKPEIPLIDTLSDTLNYWRNK